MKIVIVGGVAGGMSAAARARRHSETAEIIVLERGQYPSFANCGLPYFVSGEITSQDKLLVQTPASLKASLNLDVRVGHTVTAVHPDQQEVTVETPLGTERISYDSLILSPGADAVVPPVPGLDSQRITTLRTVDDALTLRQHVTSQHVTFRQGGTQSAASQLAVVQQGGALPAATQQGASALDAATPGSAVVIGAGFIGLEAAEALALAGYKVSVVERAPHVLPPTELEVASQVRAELERLGVDVYEAVDVTSVDSGEDADTVHLSTGEQLTAHIIVLSAGVKPATGFLAGSGIELDRGAIVVNEHGQTSAPAIWAVGDATVSTDAVTGIRRPVMLAGPANRAGRLVADHIFAPHSARAIPSALGTAIVRVGSITAAMTGANSAALDAAGVEYDTLHLHPNNHAGYFPGASQLHLTVHMRKGDGALVGAQIVGNEGADKRIDVLATAIRTGMNAADLIDLDLAYAPPYGSAKDPVNFAGMVAENVLTGQLKLWYPQEYADLGDSAFVLDVRSAAEFASGHLPDAVNIPHVELRERLDEVRELAGGRPVRITCQSGVRSYIAHRVLTEAGFDSASLSGGMITYKAVMGSQNLVFSALENERV